MNTFQVLCFLCQKNLHAFPSSFATLTQKTCPPFCFAHQCMAPETFRFSFWMRTYIYLFADRQDVAGGDGSRGAARVLRVLRRRRSRLRARSVRALRRTHLQDQHVSVWSLDNARCVYQWFWFESCENIRVQNHEGLEMETSDKWSWTPNNRSYRIHQIPTVTPA